MEVAFDSISVTESSQPAEARRAALRIASALGFGAARAGAAALVATEMATNLVKHAHRGELLLRPTTHAGSPALELLAVDHGPGIENVGAALRDGYSTTGSPGTGLGAIRRAATSFDIHSQPGHGTVVLARLNGQPPGSAAHPAPPLVVAALSRAHPGEPVCGDAAAARHLSDGVEFVVVDGLGHGEYAAEAASAAIAAFDAAAGRDPSEVLEALDAALRGTRGAAAAVARLDGADSRVLYAGVGNIAAVIAGAGPERHLVSHPGTLGFQARSFGAFTYPWPTGGVLIMHSDGLGSRWSLDAHPGLLQRDPLVIAAVLYREHARGRDDTTVLVCRESHP